MKEQLQKNIDKEGEINWSFAEWLDHFSKKPTNKELDDMEGEHKLHPINNPNYTNFKTGA